MDSPNERRGADHSGDATEKIRKLIGTCAECKWWTRNAPESEFGHCENREESAWQSDDGCIRWEEK